MDEGDYTVDLDELASVIETLEKCERALETLTDDVEKQMGVLHETWEGFSAQAQREGQEEWNLGMVEMRAALADLRQAAQRGRWQLPPRHHRERRAVERPHVSVKVQARQIEAAAQSFAYANEFAAQSYQGLTQALDGYREMAGDDYTSDEFVAQYDGAAQDAVDGFRDLVGSLAGMARLLWLTAGNHRSANKASVYRANPPVFTGGQSDPPPDSTVTVGSASVPSARVARPWHAGPVGPDRRLPRGMDLAGRQHVPCALPRRPGGSSTLLDAQLSPYLDSAGVGDRGPALPGGRRRPHGDRRPAHGHRAARSPLQRDR